TAAAGPSSASGRLIGTTAPTPKPRNWCAGSRSCVSGLGGRRSRTPPGARAGLMARWSPQRRQRIGSSPAPRRGVDRMDLLVNIDVPDIERATAFYVEAFGLTVTRRFGAGGAELSGLPAKIYLLQKADGSIGAAAERRRYERHWTPVHLDIVVA